MQTEYSDRLEEASFLANEVLFLYENLEFLTYALVISVFECCKLNKIYILTRT